MWYGTHFCKDIEAEESIPGDFLLGFSFLKDAVGVEPELKVLEHRDVFFKQFENLLRSLFAMSFESRYEIRRGVAE